MNRIKYISLIFIITGLFYQLQAQHERDTWVVGRNSVTGQSTNRLTFKNGKLAKVDTTYHNGVLLAVSSYCDPETGELLLYSDGFHVFDGKGNRIEDEILSPTYYGKREVKNPIDPEIQWGTRASGAFVILPLKEGVFGIVHQFHTFNPFHPGVDTLFYTQVQKDFSEPNKWEWKKQNEIIMEEKDNYLATVVSMCAIRHGNGRDWWVITGGMSTETTCKNESCYRFYVFLLNPEGLQLHHIERISPGNDLNYSIWKLQPNVNGSMIASIEVDMKDTSKYKGRYVRLYDFDRCKGTLELKQGEVKISPIEMAAYEGSDLDYSSSGDYLYIHNAGIIVQYVLEEEEWWSSGDTVGVWSQALDDEKEGVRRISMFAWSSLAPDGKIYISAAHGLSKYMHVIHSPEKRGVACQFEQNGLALYHVNKESVPLYVNYSLGALSGSPCDTLGLGTAVDNPCDNTFVSLYPNPVRDVLKIEINQKIKSYAIYAINGINIKSDVLNGEEIDVSGLPAGTYVLIMDCVDGSSVTEKFVKVGG